MRKPWPEMEELDEVLRDRDEAGDPCPACQEWPCQCDEQEAHDDDEDE